MRPKAKDLDCPEYKALLFRVAARTWGWRAQTDMMLEEMAELEKALLKFRRAVDFGKLSPDHLLDILEELVDVELMLGQLKFIYVTDGCRERYARIMRRKMRRTLKRLQG